MTDSGCDAATRIPSAEKKNQKSFQLFKYSSKKRKQKKRRKVKSIFQILTSHKQQVRTSSMKRNPRRMFSMHKMVSLEHNVQ